MDAVELMKVLHLLKNKLGGLPESFFTIDRPANIKDLAEVKKTAKKNDKVTFLARIGGRKNASFFANTFNDDCG